MCLAVLKPNQSSDFTIEDFVASFGRNNDGSGIMWVENGRIQVDRILGPLSKQREWYQAHKRKSRYVLHMRYSTHGAKDINNCHPFEVLNKDKGDPLDLYMVHNGVISDTNTSDNKMSDTWNFVENHLKPILKVSPELLWNDGFQSLVTKFIGGNNKLIFLDSNNKVLIFNKKAGTDVKGCWLSNAYSTNSAGVSNVYGINSNSRFSGPGGYSRYVFGERHNNYKKHYHQGKYYNNHSERAKVMESSPTIRPLHKSLIVVPDEPFKKKEHDDDSLVGTPLEEHPIGHEYDNEDTESVIIDQDIEEIKGILRSLYDPENIVPEQIQNCVDTLAKSFTYVDLEIMVQHEPQIAADVLQYLFTAYTQGNTLKEVA